jgi:hypothetical protein
VDELGARATASDLTKLGQGVERRGPHAGDVVVELLPQQLDGRRIANGTEHAHRREPPRGPRIVECRDRDLDYLAISDPPECLGDVRNEGEVNFEQPRTQNGRGRRTLQLDKPTNRGRDDFRTRVLQ